VRVELPGGKWAVLHDSLTHGERKSVLRAFLASDVDALEGPEVRTALVRAYLESWNVSGRDGHELAVADVDRALESDVAPIFDAALGLWTGRADPNASGGS
jgi:hypothetical protein